MKQQGSHKAQTARQQNSKLSNSCSLPKQCSSLHDKNPRGWSFFPEGKKKKKKDQWTCKWGQSEKYVQCISAFSKSREHFWECKYSTQTLQRHTVPAASEWQILPFPPAALTSLRHNSRTATHPPFSKLPSHWRGSVLPRRQQILLPCSLKSFLAAKEGSFPSTWRDRMFLLTQQKPPTSWAASWLSWLRSLSHQLCVPGLEAAASSQIPDPRSLLPDPWSQGQFS